MEFGVPTWEEAVSVCNRRLDPDGELANRLAALIAGSVASIRNVL
jgi:hypothetical protein